MKYFPYILFSLFLLPIAVMGQTSPTLEQNYVLQKSYQNQYTQSQLDDSSFIVPDDAMIENIVYYDGLGRPMQSVAIRAGGNREDLIIPVLYDAFGRQPKDYLPLPIAGNQGSFNENGSSVFGIVNSLLSYYEDKFPDDFSEILLPSEELNPYSEKRFELSPLNRVIEQGAPGNDWRLRSGNIGHTVKFELETNNAYEVRRFYVNYDSEGEPALLLSQNNNGNFPKKTLYKNIVKDENWISSDGTIGTTIEFTNKQGQVVLKRVRGLDPALPFNGQDSSLNHDTYYVYDDFGNLVFVLSPEGSKKIVANNALVSIKKAILDDLCYQYKYDHRNRLVWKKVPGKGYETIHYNSFDLPVLTQDANMRLDNPGKYLFTKYDALGRVAYTGFYIGGVSKDSLQNQPTVAETARTVAQGPLQIGDTQLYYSNSSFPSKSLKVLTISYYDKYIDYAVPGNNGLNLPTAVYGQYTTEHASVGTNTQGLPTVSKVRVLDQTPSQWITSLTAYDSRGRAIYSDSYNEYLESRNILRSKLELISGRPSEIRNTHVKNSKTITSVDYFTYDHMGRLLTQQQQIDNTPVQLIAKNNYDALGQLVKKQVGGETAVNGYTDIHEIDVTFDGLVTPTSSAGSWTSRLKTRGKIMEDGGISFTVEGVNNRTRVGLVKSTNTNSGNDYLDYGIFLKFENNVYKVFTVKNGSNQTTTQTYAPGDTFKVAREGTQIKYYYNSTTPFTSVAYVGNGEALTGKVAFSGPGGGLSQLSLYGPNINKVLQNVAYGYNVRGWLTDINNVEMRNIGPEIRPLFNFRMNYNKVEGNATAQPLYNGNISQTLWKTLNEDKDIRSYGYSYDRLNRITGAASYRGTKLETMEPSSEHDVKGISYDLNGNIQSLARWGADEQTIPDFGQWDALTYGYDGNQLINVLDVAGYPLGGQGFYGEIYNPGIQYIYDPNGNMKSDTNKGIGNIIYNHLNLPTEINFNSGSSIEYVYDALGTKLSKMVDEGDQIITQYAGGFIYNNAADGQMALQFFSHPEGYVEPVTETANKVKGFSNGIGTTYSIYKYVFQYKDHLGNVRLSYSDTNLDGAIQTTGIDSEIIEENNYYPFGLQHKGYNTIVSPSGNSVARKFKFNGQELEESLDLNIYEMDVRNYDPAIGRFTTIDPVTHFSQSTYTAFDNNPVFWADPTGADSESFLRDLFDRSESGTTWTNTGNGIFTDGNGNTAQCDDCNESSQEQQDPNPFGNIQVSEKQGWFGKLMGDANGRKWKGPDGVLYSVDEEGFPTGRYMAKFIGNSGSIEYISAGGLGVVLKLPKYLKHLGAIKSRKDLLRYAVKASDAFKLTSGGGKFKAVLDGGAYGAGQYFQQLANNGWTWVKVKDVIKLTKNGETIIFRTSSSGKKGFDTFTITKGYNGKNVDIFFK